MLEISQLLQLQYSISRDRDVRYGVNVGQVFAKLLDILPIVDQPHPIGCSGMRQSFFQLLNATKRKCEHSL